LVLTRAEDDVVLAVSARACRVLGGSEDGFVGRAAEELWVRPEWRRAVVERVRAGEVVEDEEAEMRRVDERLVWIATSVNRLRMDGQDCLLSALADVSRHRRLEDELRRIATIDVGTGTLSRRRWFELAQDELERCSRHGHPVALAMVDLDYFKAVNDQHGHLFGDVVLEAVARTMLHTVRRIDRVGRYGGEEFAVLLPETTRTAAAGVLDRLRDAVAALRIDHEGQAVGVTVSAGVVEFRPAEALAAALERADAALYAAKAAGRNCVRTDS
jgi:diguanylate cyclase (GGDEF)-like protein/PAS domain S-box-containing protein